MSLQQATTATLRIAVPAVDEYTPHSGIGRIFHTIRALWAERAEVVPARLRAPRPPILRNFPAAVESPARSDIVYMPRLSGAQALRQTSGLPSLITVHDIGIVDCPADQEGLDWLTRWSIRASFYGLRHASRVITDSEFTRRRLLKYLPGLADHSEVILPGVDQRFASDRAPEEARLRVTELVGRSMGRPLLLYVGSELPRKNIGLLLETLAWLRVRYPDACLLKVGRAGGARWRERTLNMAARLKLHVGSSIKLIEDVSDDELACLYRAVDLFLSASSYEGFGLPALEALAAGTPVVVTNQGSLPEIVGQVGRVANSSVDALGAAAAAALDEGRQTRAATARAWASRFRWDDTADRYLNALQTLVDNQHRREALCRPL